MNAGAFYLRVQIDPFPWSTGFLPIRLQRDQLILKETFRPLFCDNGRLPALSRGELEIVLLSSAQIFFSPLLQLANLLFTF